MEQYIKEILGCHVKKVEYNLPSQMPQYLLNNYIYDKYIIEGQECLFVSPYQFSLVSYKKQYQKIKQFTNLQIVLHLKEITPYQRKVLIEEHLSFIVENSQIFLPFLAISLVEKYQLKTEIEKFTPMTQLVFLYLFYNQQKITATDLAEKIHYSTMSVTRAYKALVDSGLFNIENAGVRKYIISKYHDGQLLKEAEPFFINPIKKTIRVSKNLNLTDYLAAGILALSKKTMLNATEFDLHYAIYSNTQPNKECFVAKSAFLDGPSFAIEEWCYNPKLLTKNDTVDDISLILSLKEHKDERIQKELEYLRRKYQWLEE